MNPNTTLRAWLLIAVLPILLFQSRAGAQAQDSAEDYDAATHAMVAKIGLRESAVPVRDLPGWRPPTRVVAWLDAPGAQEALQAVAPGAEVVMVHTPEEALAAVGEAEVLLGSCDAELLAAAPRLRWVQVYSAGVENCVAVPAMREGSKLLTNGQRLGSPALAEHAIALMMALVRGLDLYHGNQLQGEWRRDIGMQRTEFMELDGRTLLVVGLGGIGSQVALRGHGLGMRIIATRGSSREGPDYVDYVGLSDETLDLARQADVVIDAAPLTPETRGLFDRALFQAMKPTAYFVSVGRGASTVTDDLVAALRAGEIAGAGLDVTDPEPLPPGHPLWTLPRVIITPHTAGMSDKSRDRLFLLVRENLRRYVAGEALYSVVDIERGY